VNDHPAFFSCSSIDPESGQKGRINFNCYGRDFVLLFDNRGLYEKLIRILPPFHEIRETVLSGHIFELITKENPETNGLYFNGELIYETGISGEIDFEFIEAKIQFSMAVALPPEKFLLHAGAVALDKTGVIIPGNTFSGKTTLTREFIKTGAEYFSDDCAVIDKNGFLYPYSKTLSVRKTERQFAADSWGRGEQVEAQAVGAVIGQTPVKIGLVIFTEFKENQTWQNDEITRGEAVLELAQNLFYSASMTLYPSETLEALTKIAADAVVVRGIRGEAEDAVEKILRQFHSLRGKKRNL
jgi:hypothetical protein